MSKNRVSREYVEGVEYFLQFATKNGIGSNAISRPCVKCGNLKRKSVDVVRAHLQSNGMDLTYVVWIWHGEQPSISKSMNATEQAKQEEQNVDEQLVDMVHAAYEYDENPAEFVKLLEDAEKPLYPGCTKFTKLSAIVKLYNLKAKYSWSDKGFTDILSLFGEMLPDGNELPSSLYDAKKCLVALGMDYIKFHACPKDCILYHKDYVNRIDCPTCGLSRWKLCKNSKINEGVPAKVLWYFLPIPIFQRMFRNQETSKVLTWHADSRARDGHLRHPADSPSWKVVDHKWPDFASEPRNLRLALAADGINPHRLMNSTYSCWPVVLVTYNLPPTLCLKRKFMMLTLLISGPKQPGNDIDVFLEPLIDDLKKLWAEGVETYDAYRQERFNLKAVLLWTINDFPAYGNLTSQDAV